MHRFVCCQPRGVRACASHRRARKSKAQQSTRRAGRALQQLPTSAFDTVGLLMMRGFALAQLANASRCTSPILEEKSQRKDTRTDKAVYIRQLRYFCSENFQGLYTPLAVTFDVLVAMVSKSDDTHDS